MDAQRKAQIDRYFAGFHGKMGRLQAVKHLRSQPRWWKLRDRQGRTPLMRAMEAAGFGHKELFNLLIDVYETRSILTATDLGGKNLWWHLLLHQAYRSDERTQGWIPLLRNDIPLQASTTSGRGIFVDMILPRTNRQWSSFFPKSSLGHGLYQMSTSTYDTWWHCDEDNAERVANWLLGVRDFRFPDTARSIGRCLDACARNDPQGFDRLPMPLRGALMLLEFMHGDRERAQRAQDAGVHVFVGSRIRARLEKEASLRPAFIGRQLQQALLANDEATLAATTVAAPATARLRRL